MSELPEPLQNDFLNTLRKERTPVSVFLINGIRLAGHIQSFDQYSIRLNGATPQLVLKRVVATVVPERGRARREAGAASGRPAAAGRPRTAGDPAVAPRARLRPSRACRGHARVLLTFYHRTRL
jgi:host factor-I protein